MHETKNDLPQGFSAALKRNLPAMRFFTALTDAEKENVAERARNVKSKEEMISLVAGLSEEYNPLNRKT